MSPEFKDLVVFARYVGPKILDKHHLDRIDPHLGYALGNLRWADNETRASNKRKTRFHEYMGHRLTDRELSVVMMKMGVKYLPDSIKKYRQYWQKKGLPLPEITEKIFRKHNLQYHHSDDPVENADFPEKHRQQMAKAYRYQRHQNETRIEFAVRWLDAKAVEAEALAAPLLADFYKKHLLELAATLRFDAGLQREEIDRLRNRRAEFFLARFPEQAEMQVQGWPTEPQLQDLPPDPVDEPPPPIPAPVGEERATEEEVLAAMREFDPDWQPPSERVADVVVQPFPLGRLRSFDF